MTNYDMIKDYLNTLKPEELDEVLLVAQDFIQQKAQEAKRQEALANVMNTIADFINHYGSLNLAFNCATIQIGEEAGFSVLEEPNTIKIFYPPNTEKGLTSEQCRDIMGK